MGKRCSFVLAGSDVEDGMSSEAEKGSYSKGEPSAVKRHKI